MTKDILDERLEFFTQQVQRYPFHKTILPRVNPFEWEDRYPSFILWTNRYGEPGPAPIGVDSI